MSFVLDPSSLIYLGKLRILEKIRELEGKKLVPKSVYNEVVKKGRERNEPEAAYIDELIKKKIITVKSISAQSLGNIPFLSEADKDVIALAEQTKSIAIIDELYANSIAESFKIESHGTVYILLALMQKGAMTKKQAVEHIDKMISFGFYLSAEKYKEILKSIEKM